VGVLDLFISFSQEYAHGYFISMINRPLLMARAAAWRHGSHKRRRKEITSFIEPQPGKACLTQTL
jgi:hypothetical protein